MAASFHISHISSIGKGNVKLCFCFNRIRTLIAMGTYSFHSLIMGKVEIYIFFCLNGDVLLFFLQNCLFRSPLCCIILLSKSLYLIGCQGDKKG